MFLYKVSVTSSEEVYVISAYLRELHNDCHTHTDNFMVYSLLPALLTYLLHGAESFLRS